MYLVAETKHIQNLDRSRTETESSHSFGLDDDVSNDGCCGEVSQSMDPVSGKNVLFSGANKNSVLSKKKGLKFNSDACVVGQRPIDAVKWQDELSSQQPDQTATLLRDIYSDINAPSSPTSMSLYMVESLLAPETNRQSNSNDSNAADHSQFDAPIESLQYFKYLNERARR